MIQDVSGDGAADVVGFGNNGVTVATAACPRRVIPLRVMQALPCDPDQGGSCSPHSEYEDLRKAVERANQIWEGPGVEYWIQSDEHHYAPQLSDIGDNDLLDFSQVVTELQRMFVNLPQSGYPGNNARREHAWLKNAAAMYGDPNSVSIFHVTTNGQSDARSPWHGRSLNLHSGSSALIDPDGFGVSTLAHELGHYMGLPHFYENPGRDPKTDYNSNYSKCDAWDAWYKPGSTPQFFTGPNDPGCAGSGLQNIAANVIVTGADPLALFNGVLDGVTYAPGSNAMKGVLFATGLPHEPPDSYGWGYNVMHFQTSPVIAEGGSLSGRTPRFFAESQKRMIHENLAHNGTYQEGFSELLTDTQTLPQGAIPYALTSLRAELGQADDDFIWWSNADFVDDFSFTYERRDISGLGYEPVSGDFDGDGRDDVVWYTPHNGAAAFWWFVDGGIEGDSGHNFGAGARLFVGDFDGNGKDDIYVYRPGPANDYIHFGLGNRNFNVVQKNVATHYRPVAGDLDGDGDDDVVWYSPITGSAIIWWSHPQIVLGNTVFVASPSTTVGDGRPYLALVGDFDGDGGDDIYWYRGGPGLDRIWRSNGTEFPDELLPNDSPQGSLSPFVGDFDGDGKSDIFWDAPGTSRDFILPGAAAIASGSSWHPFADPQKTTIYGSFRPVAGDFDMDQDTDIIWYRRH